MKKLLFVILAGLLIIVTVLSACSQTSTSQPTGTTSTAISSTVTGTTPATTSAKPPTTVTSVTTSAPPATSTQAHWWDSLGQPQYGGTITYWLPAINPIFDPWYGGPFGGQLYQFETMFGYNWTIDRTTWPFKSGWTPEDYNVGTLAESWQIPDPQNLIINLRHGIHWQNLPPVNGREFDARDVEFWFHRELGSGDGYTKPTPYNTSFVALMEQATAMDKYTVKITFKYPTSIGLVSMMEPATFHQIAPMEAVKASPLNDDGTQLIKDYKLAIGTGPWIETDFTTGTAATFSKNPDYWGTDERHPQNKLPYADSLKLLIIPDSNTAVAALRTGQIDFLGFGGPAGGGLTWQQVASIQKTNPDIQAFSVPNAGWGVDFRVDTAPFTDIRVRQAISMAIDRQTIAKTYYGGTVDGIPAGLLPPVLKGWAVPFSDWPADLQQGYTYNLSAARQLMADAGFPHGFKTNVIASASSDLQLLQILQAEFKEIGVDMEIKTLDPVTFNQFNAAGKNDQMVYSQFMAQNLAPPWTNFRLRTDYPSNYTHNNDTAFNKMVDSIIFSTDRNTLQKDVQDADLYVLSKYWSAGTFPTIGYNLLQPYLKGYDGENMQRNYFYTSRWWIDQNAKKTMGR